MTMQYIGIDLGDGESAVAVLTEESVIDPVVQPLGGVRSILSVVGSKGEAIYIGEKALLEQGIEALRVRFKSRFLTSPVAGDDLRRFAMGLRALLLQYTDALTSGPYRIAVGCPAGWNAMDRQRYASILQSVGFDNLYTVSEARAAFLYAKYAHDILVDATLLERNALVVDIGSSTTDFAYIAGGREMDVGSFGHTNLGGGLIEAALLRESVERSPNRDAIEAVFQAEPTWKHHTEIAARRLKEAYFANEDAWLSQPCTTTAMIYYDEPLALTMSLDAETVLRLLHQPMAELGGNSFADTLTESLQRAVLSTQDAPPELVILTGGASRMRFFQEACQAAFPEAVIAFCPEPEFSTAKGLAYAARIDTRLALFHEDIQAFFDSGKIEAYVSDSLGTLVDAIVPTLADVIIEKAVLPAIRSWRSGKTGTLNDLERSLTRQARDLLSSQEAMDALAPAIAGWSERLIGKIQRELDAICARRHIDRRTMSLGQMRADAELEGIRITLPGKSLSVVLYVVSAVLVASLCGGGGAAIIATGPLGLILGAAIGLLAAMLSVVWGEQVYRSVNIPPLLRKAFPMWSFTKTLRSDRQRRSIEGSLREALSDPEGAFARQVAADIARDLNAQIALLAQQVEMPVY